VACIHKHANKHFSDEGLSNLDLRANTRRSIQPTAVANIGLSHAAAAWVVANLKVQCRGHINKSRRSVTCSNMVPL